jgi:hypothetical protein
MPPARRSTGSDASLANQLASGITDPRQTTQGSRRWAALALVLIAAWLLLVAGVRTLIQTRRTGTASSPRSGTDPGPRSGGPAAVGARLRLRRGRPLAELAGLEPITVLDRTPVRRRPVGQRCQAAHDVAPSLARGHAERRRSGACSQQALILDPRPLAPWKGRVCGSCPEPGTGKRPAAPQNYPPSGGRLLAWGLGASRPRSLG